MKVPPTTCWSSESLRIDYREVLYRGLYHLLNPLSPLPMVTFSLNSPILINPNTVQYMRTCEIKTSGGMAVI